MLCLIILFVILSTTVNTSYPSKFFVFQLHFITFLLENLRKEITIQRLRYQRLYVHLKIVLKHLTFAHDAIIKLLIDNCHLITQKLNNCLHLTLRFTPHWYWHVLSFIVRCPRCILREINN